MSKYIELIDKYRIEQSPLDTDYNPPSYIWDDNTGEVVRCKDCKYHNKNIYCTEHYRIKNGNFIYSETDNDDYCSRAVKKDADK